MSAAAMTVPQPQQLDPSQVTIPFVVENAKAVAGVGMAVLGTGLVVMILLSSLGNCGLQSASNDEAYAPAAVAVQVHAHKRQVCSSVNSISSTNK